MLFLNILIIEKISITFRVSRGRLHSIVQHLSRPAQGKSQSDSSSGKLPHKAHLAPIKGSICCFPSQELSL